VKILQVLPALEGGGVETGTLELARYLVDQGHESWVVSAGGAMEKRLLAEGSHHQDWDLGKKSVMTLRHVFAVRRWLREQAFDSCICALECPHGLFGWLGGVFLSRVDRVSLPQSTACTQ
jgi:hypothetical protein